MSIESIIGGMTPSEKMQAMELIWRDLVRAAPDFVSPAWHEKIITDRLQNPASGAALDLAEAKAEILANLNARRTQG